MTLLLGIDFGTSYFKVALFDPTGGLRGLGRVAVETLSPRDGYNELPVDRFWALLRQGLGEALRQAEARPEDIAGLSYASQANTFLLLDGNDAPLTPLIIWNDRRADPLEPAVEAFGRSADFQRTVGFAGLAPGFAPVKWRWLQRHQPAVANRAARLMTLADYFTFSLTGERVGDASTAAFTGLYSLVGREWWPAVLAFFDLAPDMLSRPLTPGMSCGRTVTGATERLGLPAGLPFAVGGLDHHVAAIGSGLDRFADASISTGTVLAALKLVDQPEPVESCFHGPHCDGRRYYRLAFAAPGATQLEDYQRSFAPHLDIARLVSLAEGTATRQGADLSEEERQHGKRIHEIMERISTTQRVLLHKVQGGIAARRVLATGGGARSGFWLQMNADVLDATVIALAGPERACLGAAAFAAVAAGIHPDIGEAIDTMVRVDRTLMPKRSPQSEPGS